MTLLFPYCEIGGIETLGTTRLHEINTDFKPVLVAETEPRKNLVKICGYKEIPFPTQHTFEIKKMETQSFSQ